MSGSHMKYMSMLLAFDGDNDIVNLVGQTYILRDNIDDGVVHLQVYRGNKRTLKLGLAGVEHHPHSISFECIGDHANIRDIVQGFKHNFYPSLKGFKGFFKVHITAKGCKLLSGKPSIELSFVLDSCKQFRDRPRFTKGLISQSNKSSSARQHYTRGDKVPYTRFNIPSLTTVFVVSTDREDESRRRKDKRKHDEREKSVPLVGGVSGTGLQMGDNVLFHLNSEEKELIKGLSEVDVLAAIVELSLVSPNIDRSKIVQLEKDLEGSQADLATNLKANRCAQKEKDSATKVATLVEKKRFWWPRLADCNDMLTTSFYLNKLIIMP
ncbi:hypothetical protein V8G54_028453 [Vigna mungo]|uniref:Uncharacterized protein n=1 Tax=Vigna mungo TaxID=3915 RepID=A0AAQ3MS01_VIGMU